MKRELYALSILRSDESRFIVLWLFRVCLCARVCVRVCACVSVCLSVGTYVIEWVQQHCLVKVKTTSPCAHYKGIWRKGDKAHLTFDSVSIFRAVVSFILFPLYPWQEDFQCPLNTQIGGTQKRLGSWRRGKCFCICVRVRVRVCVTFESVMLDTLTSVYVFCVCVFACVIFESTVSDSVMPVPASQSPFQHLLGFP
jgi:hypothetical protein